MGLVQRVYGCLVIAAAILMGQLFFSGQLPANEASGKKMQEREKTEENKEAKGKEKSKEKIKEKKEEKQTDASKPSQSLVIYTSRGEELIQPVIDLYSEQTGTKVRYQTGSSGMFIEKIKAQGTQVEADVFMTVDAGNLWAAKEAGLLKKVELEAVEKAIPSAYRDGDGSWWGVSLRARTIIYNPSLVKVTELSTYEDLATSKWKNKLCLRTAKKVYNQSLVAMLMHYHGIKKTKEIVSGWVANLATSVFSNDTHLIEAIASGKCAVGIANSYYLGRLQKKNPQIQAKIFWVSGTTGVHLNVSGLGILKHAKNIDAAKEFVEFLLTPKAQEMFAGLNLEYPVVKATPLDPIVSAWGVPSGSKMPLTEVGRLQKAAIKVMDSAGYK